MDEVVDASSMDLAIQFLRDNPSEKPVTAARIYHVNPNTLKSNIRRTNKSNSMKPTKRGGQNKILTEAQIKAVYKYVEDSYYAGYGASKEMVKAAISRMREVESKTPPSDSWFQQFMHNHTDLFRVIKTKAIARVRVTAQDIKTLEQWFEEYNSWCTSHKIEPQHMYNFDESGFRVGCAPGETVIVPAYVDDVCITYLFYLMI